MKDLNLQELNDFELQNIEGGWLELIGAAIGIAIGLGEIAHQLGKNLGETYGDAIYDPIN